MALMRSFEMEAACAVYREALKNVLRSNRGLKKIANKALFGNTKQRGKEMLKLVKAGVQVAFFMRRGTQEDFEAALANLEAAYKAFGLKGVTARQWATKEKLYGSEK